MLKRIKLSGLFVSLIFIVWSSCVSPPGYPVEPVITFESVNKTLFEEGVVDSLFIVFSFTDGDGDLGDEDSVNITLRDSRAPDFPIYYKIPFIESQGNITDISGTIQLAYTANVCLGENSQDTVVYSLSIHDRAGHQSNEISTPSIYVNCEP